MNRRRRFDKGRNRLISRPGLPKKTDDLMETGKYGSEIRVWNFIAFT